MRNKLAALLSILFFFSPASIKKEKIEKIVYEKINKKNALVYEFPISEIKIRVMYGKLDSFDSFLKKAQEKYGDKLEFVINGTFWHMRTGKPVGKIVDEGKLLTNGIARIGADIVYKNDHLDFIDWKKADARWELIREVEKKKAFDIYKIFIETKNGEERKSPLFDIKTKAKVKKIKTKNFVSYYANGEAATIKESRYEERYMLYKDKLYIKNKKELWKDYETVIGGAAWLYDGIKESFKRGIDPYRTRPRTAIGKKENNVVIFLTFSTIKQLSEMAKSLGLEEAVAIDAGNSRGFACRVDEKMEIIRMPKRKISNVIIGIKK